MVEHWLDKELVLDITVNIIPFAIIVFFLLLFTFFNPWGVALTGTDALPTVVMYGLLIFKLTTLTIITYLSAKYISRDER